MAEWDAEVAVDESLVRALLSEQVPELDAASARFLGQGWDNSVWVVEERWAFRFPRRAIAIPGVEREIALLPRLAPLLPVPIPEPRFVGAPSERFPWPFFGAPFLDGREPADAGLDDERLALASDLGRFLRVLHDLELDVELPRDPLGRADMAVRVPRALECLAEVEARGLWTAPTAARRMLDEAGELRMSGATALVHGDLHLRHALVERGTLSAVIDWGDVCVGDPSIDLHLVFCLFSPEARRAFVQEYGEIGEERVLRARATALYFCAMLASYAESVGHTSLLREAVAGLERTLAD